MDSETDIFDYNAKVSAGEVELIVVMNEMEMGVVAELSRDGNGSHGRRFWGKDRWDLRDIYISGKGGA